MNVKVTRLTKPELINLACSYTSNAASKIKPRLIYRCEHSPMRTQMFLIECIDVPTFVVNHIVRHHIQPFVQSNRPDRNGGNTKIDRNTPINFCFVANAQNLIDMSRKRLCRKASEETQELMWLIKEEIRTADPDLYEFMVPECVYRKGCHELRTCGWYQTAYIEPLIKMCFDTDLDEEYRRDNLRRFFK